MSTQPESCQQRLFPESSMSIPTQLNRAKAVSSSSTNITGHVTDMLKPRQETHGVLADQTEVFTNRNFNGIVQRRQVCFQHSLGIPSQSSKTGIRNEGNSN
jgi:hypothetical protein